MITKLLIKLLSAFNGRMKLLVLGIVLSTIAVIAFISLFSISKKRTTQNRAALTKMRPINAALSNFVKVNNGEFYIGDKKFYPYGTNYFPSYYNTPNFQILPQNGKHQNFLASPYYDSHINLLEKELQDMQDIGFNTISIQAPPIENPNGLSNLQDFLSRAEKHNLMVSIYLRNCDPLVFDKKVWQYFDEKSCIEQLKEMNIIENTAIFAYQIAWEPTLGSYDEQQNNPILQQAWNKWLIERYGSLDDAKKNWSTVRTPAERHAYQRFVSDYSSKQYNKIVQKIKRIDPNHLITARTPYWDIVPSAAREFDFVSLESWFLPVKIDKGASLFYGNGFAVEYSRMLSNNKPVTFFEFGENTLGLECLNQNKAFTTECYKNTALSTQQSQAFYYKVFYDMALKTRVKGLFNWYYVGKRPFKNAPWEDREITDYGLREVPDDDSGNKLGNQKLAFDVVRENQTKFVQNENKLEYGDEIVIDEENYQNYDDFYNKGAQLFSQKLSQGKYPLVKTNGTLTNSLNTPALCIGNIPYNDRCPHKFLNAEFNYIEVLDNTGEWIAVESGDKVIIKPDKPIMMRISAKNIGEAAWLSKSEKGKGVVQIRGSKKSPYSGDYVFIKTISDDVGPVNSTIMENIELSKGIQQDTTVYIQMFSSWLYMFGEQFKITFVPACKIPAKPTNVRLKNSVDKNYINVSWSKIPNANTYAIRVDDRSNGWGDEGSCTKIKPGDYCENNLSKNYYQFKSEKGHNYSVWIHGRNACGDWGSSSSRQVSIK